MALAIKIPTTKTFFVKEIPEDPGLAVCAVDDKEAVLTFRQATNGNNQERMQIMSERRYRFDANDRVFDEIANINPMAMSEIEVRMTLMETDITFPDGTALEFEGTGIARKPKDIKQFQAWWAALPPGWGSFIYDRCLEVNPNWGLKSGG